MRGLWLCSAWHRERRSRKMRKNPKESLLHAEWRREGERVSDACTFSFKAIPMCGYTLLPTIRCTSGGQHAFANGFGLGGAFVWTRTRNWRLSWDADAIGAISAAPGALVDT